jgi:hypothetical protein
MREKIGRRALIGVALLSMVGGALAQADPRNELPPQQSLVGSTLTAKERSSGKAADEQRVDNCKIPPEKRGSQPRPDSCDHAGSRPVMPAQAGIQ